MEIGGTDIVIEADRPLRRFNEVVAVILRTWPQAVLEDADTGGPLCAGTDAILAYRNSAAFISWEEHGATDTNGDDMLHVIFGLDELTCVVDGPDTEAMAEKIRALVTAA